MESTQPYLQTDLRENNEININYLQGFREIFTKLPITNAIEINLEKLKWLYTRLNVHGQNIERLEKN